MTRHRNGSHQSRSPSGSETFPPSAEEFSSRTTPVAGSPPRPASETATLLLAGASLFVGLPLLLASIAGCGGDGIARHRVAGSVTFDGKPLPAGEIYFEPDASQGNVGPTGYAQVREGRYDTAGDPPGRGAIGGPQRVRIEGYEMRGTGAAAPAAAQGAGEPAGVTLFRDYRTTVTLPNRDSTEDFAVPSSAGERR